MAFHVYKWSDESTGSAGLNIVQWIICIAFGSGTLIVRFFLKLLSIGRSSNTKVISLRNFLFILKIVLEC